MLMGMIAQPDDGGFFRRKGNDVQETATHLLFYFLKVKHLKQKRLSVKFDKAK